MKKENYPVAKAIKKVIKRRPFKQIVLNVVPLFYTFIESRLKLGKDVELHLLPVLCDSQKTSLDVGVLWGAYTFQMRKCSKNVVCFEPNPFMCRHLKSAFKNNVTVNNVGISDKLEKMTLRIPYGRPGNATVELSNPLSEAKGWDEVEVDVVPIDSFQLTNVGFVKIDVEGHEQAAMRGMAKLLETEKPNILVEVEERHKKNAVQEVADFLQPLGYQLYFVKGKQISPVSKLLPEDQDSTNRGTWNYIKNFIGLHNSTSEKVFTSLEGRFGISLVK